MFFVFTESLRSSYSYTSLIMYKVCNIWTFSINLYLYKLEMYRYIFFSSKLWTVCNFYLLWNFIITVSFNSKLGFT